MTFTADEGLLAARGLRIARSTWGLDRNQRLVISSIADRLEQHAILDDPEAVERVE